MHFQGDSAELNELRIIHAKITNQFEQLEVSISDVLSALEMNTALNQYNNVQIGINLN